MNWKLISLLSLFGIATNFTANVISLETEMIVYLAIYVIIAAIVGRKAPGKYFLHGFIISVGGCAFTFLTGAVVYHSFDPNPYLPIILPVISTILGSMCFIASRVYRGVTLLRTRG